MAKDVFERRARLVMLAYAVLGGMDPPPENLSDKEIFLTIASEALRQAASATGPPKLPPPDKPRLPAFLRYRLPVDD